MPLLSLLGYLELCSPWFILVALGLFLDYLKEHRRCTSAERIALGKQDRERDRPIAVLKYPSFSRQEEESRDAR